MTQRLSLKTWALLIAAVVALLALGAGLRAWAESRFDVELSGVVSVAGDYTIDSAIYSDVAAVARSIHLLPGVAIDGDAAFIGTSVLIEGIVDGDLTIIADTVTIAPGAAINSDAAISARMAVIDGRVDGDLLVTAEKLTVAAGAVIDGDIFPCVPATGQVIGGERAVESCNAAQQADLFRDARESAQSVAPEGETSFFDIFSAVLLTGMLAGLTTLVVMFLPDRLLQIELTAQERARDSFGAFVAALCVAIGITALLALMLALFTPLGLALLPVAALLAVAFLLLLATGLVVASARLGRAIFQRISPGQPPLIGALLGSLVVSLPLWLSVLFPDFGLLALAILILTAASGTGAAILTRYGAQPVRRAYFVQG